ncbi:MAG: GAF domain-containing sensor histidine kinase [Actinomycetota bacterium]
MKLARPRARSRPEPGELVSLQERVGSLSLMRAGFAFAVLAVGFVAPDVRGVSMGLLALVTCAYMVPALALPLAIRRLSRQPAVLLSGVLLLFDGVYLTWVTYATGGVQSPLRFLLFAHVVAVTLIASSRTGLKVAAWNSLLLLVVLYAQAAWPEIIETKETLVSALPGEGEHFRLFAMLNVVALWAVALVTAAFSSVNERELRAQKVDLHQLSAMVREIDARTDASDIPNILLDKLSAVFGFTRGVILASPELDLAVLAYRGDAEPPLIVPGLDPVMERAWKHRRTQLVNLDPGVDRRLGALFPFAGRLVVVPLFLDRGQRLGILALENPANTDRIKRWTVTVIEQFAAHAAMAMQNAWLLDEIRHRLEENRALQRELMAEKMSLEVAVDARTTELSDSLRSLRLVEDARRKLVGQLVHAQEEERVRIAEDIHDDPVQKVVAASMRLQLIRKQVQDPDVRASLDKLLESIRASIFSLRHMIFELHPSVLEHEGLAPALREHMAKLESELEFELQDDFEEQPSGETRVLLFRIAQEALGNVLKHARAQRVEVHLSQDDGGFKVEIRDDGVGFTPPQRLSSAPGHLGLSSMRERAELAGGWCQVHSLPDCGTTVQFWLPATGPTTVGQIELEDADRSSDEHLGATAS